MYELLVVTMIVVLIRAAAWSLCMYCHGGRGMGSGAGQALLKVGPVANCGL